MCLTAGWVYLRNLWLDMIFIMATRDHSQSDSEEVRLAAPDGLSEFERALRSTPLPTKKLPKPERERFRFSLMTMMLLVLFAAVGLSGHSWMSPPVFAGAVGLVVLFCLVWRVYLPPKSRCAQIIWWGLNLAYLSAIVAALLRTAT